MANSRMADGTYNYHADTEDGHGHGIYRKQSDKRSPERDEGFDRWGDWEDWRESEEFLILSLNLNLLSCYSSFFSNIPAFY